jgi:hypothetical protein
MKRHAVLLSLLILSLLPGTLFARDKRDFTETFPLADCEFSADGANSYFSLQPGRVLSYDNAACVDAGDCDEEETLVIRVLDETRDIDLTIDGQLRVISTRVIEEYEEAGGEFAERSLNFFALCTGTGDVYYFGEEVFVPDENGNPQGGAEGPGAWLAGEDDAMPGIIMPGGAFLLGSRYFQEMAPDIALDRAEHTAAGFDIVVPAGDFAACGEVTETTPLEKKGTSVKVYCPGVGLIIDDDLELRSIE